jgi:hypothetical protein
MPCTIQAATPVHFDFMRTPLRNITPTPDATFPTPPTPGTTPTAGGGGAGFGPDPVVQTVAGGPLNFVWGVSFDAIGDAQHQPAPDANGDVGPYQYVQWVMNDFAVFNKGTGAVVYGPAPGATLFRGFGGPCEMSNKGDPVVLYDQLANRWVLMDLAATAVGIGSPGATQCMAVSETEDATGRYYRYQFDIPGGFPDYSKIGLWPDAYYYTADPNGRGLACAFERSAMLTGAAARQQCCLTLPSGAYFRLLPSDLDGTSLPPSGAPNYFVNLNMITDAVQLWRFHVDFTTSTNSKFNGPYPIVGVAQFEGFGCSTDALLTECVPQAGVTQKLWTLGTHVMHRLAYRHVQKQGQDYYSMVVNHSVHLDEGKPSERVGVRWYEIHDPGGTPTVFQQGTFAPGTTYRWMGSVATDRLGDVAAGYSMSSSDMHPSIAITGHAVGDAPGIMGNESVVVAGGGSQVQLGADDPNWGDYTSMSVDPSFDCQFWYTNEYLPTDGYANWRTEVVSFRFPSCAPCVGDCTHDGQVTASELSLVSSILLGTAPYSSCIAADGNSDGQVTVDEYIQALNNHNNGCPAGTQAAPTGWLAAPLGVTITQAIGSASGARGARITIPVTLDGGGGTIAATQLDLLYPSNVLSSPTCTAASGLPDQVLTTSAPTDPVAVATAARYRTMLVDPTGVSPIPDGELFSCTFTIKRTAPSGTFPISGDRQHVSDGTGNEPPSAVTSGAVTVF